jgi:hypothetical protein
MLNNQLLPFEKVDQWIKLRLRDCVYPHALLVRLKPGFKLDLSTRQLEPPLSSLGSDAIEALVPVDSLDYAIPGSNSVHRVSIGRDGTLRVTYELSKSLASVFRWQQAQATVFLLTDITPLLTDRVEITPGPFTRLPWGGLLPLACLSRLTLTIDPLTTVREVEQIYAKLRKELLVRKPRAQDRRHLKLAVFAVKHPVLDAEAMREWDRKYPSWRYGRVSLFAQHARVARDRLLHNSAVDPWQSFARQS